MRQPLQYERGHDCRRLYPNRTYLVTVRHKSLPARSSDLDQLTLEALREIVVAGRVAASGNVRVSFCKNAGCTFAARRRRDPRIVTLQHSGAKYVAVSEVARLLQGQTTLGRRVSRSLFAHKSRHRPTHGVGA